MDEFPSNSHEQKTERVTAKKKEPLEKKVERVTQSEVIRRKTPLSTRFRETFTGGDARGVWGYVVMDVLIPAAKDMIADATTQGVERMIFGDSRGSSRRRGGNGARPAGANGYVNYGGYSSGSGGRRDSTPISRGARTNHNFDEIILATRVEAEEVIDRLLDIIQSYDSATVADLYELVGVSGNYTDAKWGWTDLRGSDVTRIRDGYLLNLPKPSPLD